MRTASWSRYLRRWEFLLFICLIVVIVYNSLQVSNFLTAQNQANLLQLSIEKAIVALIMTFVIISGEIDLSVASMMGLSAAVVARLHESGWNMALAIVAALAIGLMFGAMNGFFVAKVGINSLAVTLAGYIGFRGLAEVFIEDNSMGDFPHWFTHLGQNGLIGPITFSIMLFVIMAVVATIVLHFSGFGRRVYAIGSNARGRRLFRSAGGPQPHHHFCHERLCRGAGRRAVHRSPWRGSRQHRPGIRARHHHHRATRRREHLWRRGLDGGRISVDLARAEHPQRHDDCRDHRQHADRRDRTIAHSFRAHS